MIERRVELAEGYRIAPVIQGCWQLSEGHRLQSDGDAGSVDWVELLARRALEGKTTFDCADIYSGVEELLGRVRRRILELGGDEPQIHTKCVPDLAKLGALRKRDLEQTIDRSLSRLGVERLDLVQFHWWDLEIEGVEQAGLWLDEMRRAGKIRHLGATNFTTDGLRRLLDAGVPIVAHQVQYSLLDRRPARAMAALCRERDVALLCYGALAGGLLSSRALRDGLDQEPRSRSEIKYRLVVEEVGGWQPVERMLSALSDVGTHPSSGDSGPDDAEPSSVDPVVRAAVQWVLEQPRVAAAIVGASAHRDLPLDAVCGRPATGIDPSDFGIGEVPGDVYQLERDREGRHGRIMRYDLQE